MIKTKIKFEDIKAGDLLEVHINDSGVKTVATGIAFRREELTTGRDWEGNEERQVLWNTSEGGMIVASGEEAEVWRVDVTEDKFEDIRAGDRIRVTTETESGRKDIVEDTVVTLVNGMNSFWLNKEPDTVVFEKFWEGDGTKRTIEILERGA